MQVTSLIQHKEVWAFFPKSWDSLISTASSMLKKKSQEKPTHHQQSPQVAAVSLCKLMNKKPKFVFQIYPPFFPTFGTCLWLSLKMSLGELALLKKLMDKFHCKFILQLRPAFSYFLPKEHFFTNLGTCTITKKDNCHKDSQFIYWSLV